jgi:N-methylhydantoinase A
LELDTTLAAFGVSEVVEENMANAARVHAVERGAELEGRTMIAFGGGAPLHAARLAEKLGIHDVLIPASAGVGSAVGFLRAPIAFEVVRSRFVRFSSFDADSVNAMFSDMNKEATSVVRLGAATAPIETTRSAEMRYAGQGHEILVPLPDHVFTAADLPDLRARFEAGYRVLFGRLVPGVDIEVTAWILRASAPAPGRAVEAPVPAMARAGEGGKPVPIGTRVLFDPSQRDFHDVPVYGRATLRPGATLSGPAIIAEDETTTVITAGFTAVIDSSGAIRLTAKSVALQEAAQ